ncbi:MAG: ComF family protein, partial [Gammaproteobacteria bacterium]|nr:ComF family protein [Gammaproteobacteria bacterium]
MLRIAAILSLQSGRGSGSNGFMQLLKAVYACRNQAGDALRQLDNSIMPLRCVFCGTKSRPGEGRICCGCHSDLPWIVNACALCAEPVAAELPSSVHCAACQKRQPPFQAMVAPLRYEFPVDAGLKALKFGRRLYYGAAFGELLVAEVRRRPADIDALLPVPL